MKKLFALIVLIFVYRLPLYGQGCYVGARVVSAKYETRTINTSLQGFFTYTYRDEWVVSTTYEVGDYVEYGGKFYQTLTGGAGQAPGMSPDWEEVTPPSMVYRSETQTFSYDYLFTTVIDRGPWCPPRDSYDLGESRYVQTRSYDDGGNIVISGCSGEGKWDSYYDETLWEFWVGRYVSCDYYLGSMTWAG